MSDFSAFAKRVTERDAVLRERAAFVCGMSKRHGLVSDWRWSERDAAGYAAARYPLHTVTRPRVVTDPHAPYLRWRAAGAGCVQISARFGHFTDYPRMAEGVTVDAARAALFVDLLARPTEEVEAES